jgi:hypothetical protein
MKKLILLLLLIPSLAWGQVSTSGVSLSGCSSGGVSAAACTSVTVDFWQTFEFDDSAPISDTTALAANDNAAGTWTTMGTVALSDISTDATKSLSFCPGGVADTGTRGYRWSTDAATNYCNISYSAAAGHDTLSIGFWFQITAGIVNMTDCPLFSFTSSGLARLSIKAERVTNHYLKFSGGTGNTGTLSVGTWYWVVAKYVRNGTSTLRVYNEAGSAVGGDSTISSGDYAIDGLSIGQGSSCNQATNYYYWDNVIADWTDATCIKPDGSSCTW